MSVSQMHPSTAPSGRFWLASYPDGMAPEIAPLRHTSIGAHVESCCAEFADRPAFTSMGKTLTFRDFDAASAGVAAWLQARGLEKGDRVAVMMPNILQNPVIIFGILRAGLVVVNVNPLYTPRELEHQLKDAGAKALFVLENFAGTVAQVVSRTALKHVVVATMGDMLGLKGLIVNLVVRKVKKLVPAWSLPGHVPFRQVMAEGARSTARPVSIAPGDTAFLQYTGGTTGVSKGATLTHANLLSNMEQIKLWIEPTFTIKKRPEQLVFVCALPLYHIFALTVNALMGMQQGAMNVLIPNPRDIPGFVKELAKQPFHIFPGLNTLFNALANNEEFRRMDFSPLRLTLGGGMAVQKAVAERWKALTGNHITEGYGLSETSPVATANKCSSPDFTGTIGLPIPSTEIAIRDEDGGDLPLGEVGEICIRGPQVMEG
ncbi:MAG: AMP-binding protein, partial [Rhizobiales bacterium]|nr:AMP-binding protein [Hyphomicrobiales bacterium]